MKRLGIAIVLMGVLVLTLVGCGAKDKEREQVHDYSGEWGQNKTFQLGSVGGYIPGAWTFTVNENAQEVNINPSEGKAARFRLTKEEMTYANPLADMTQEAITQEQKDLVETTLKYGDFEKAKFVSDETSSVTSPKGDKERQDNTLRYTAKKGEKYEIFATFMNIDDTIYVLWLFQSLEDKYDFLLDYNDIAGSVWNTADAFQNPATAAQQGAQENQDADAEDAKDGDAKTDSDNAKDSDQKKDNDNNNQSDTKKDEDYEKDVTGNGAVSDVDDSQASSGKWVVYVNDSWKKLSKADKQKLADSVLGSVKVWSKESYNNDAPTVTMQDADGNIVAEGSNAMTIKG